MIASAVKKTFKDNFYLEIQRHNDNGEKLFESFLLNASEKFSLPLIATQEVFYLDKEHKLYSYYSGIVYPRLRIFVALHIIGTIYLAIW